MYRIAGDFRKAIEYYTKAIAMKPTYADAWNNTGNCYGMLKEYQKAMEAYKKLLELSPNNANATNNLGITYMLLGDSVTGRQYVEKARQMMGN
nr:tetratricopeptide repeat protein [Bacteroidota bacterium]